MDEPLPSLRIPGRRIRHPLRQGERVGKTVDYYGGRNQYIGYLISLSRNSFQGYKVGLTAPTAAPDDSQGVFDALGAQTMSSTTSPRTNINRTAAAPISGTCKVVVDEGLDWLCL